MEEKKKKEIPQQFKRYTKTIETYPEWKSIKVFAFDTKEEAFIKAGKVKSWPYKYCVKARDDKGRLMKGWALVCLK